MTTNFFSPEIDRSSLDTGSRFLFTSEHVGCGHPDKLADTIPDSLLDACLAVRIERCAIETAIFQNQVLIFGECGGGPMNDPKFEKKQSS